MAWESTVTITALSSSMISGTTTTTAVIVDTIYHHRKHRRYSLYVIFVAGAVYTAALAA